ncbi:DUF3991 and TOPRIM domain-containing protein [Eubacterium callanderi]|uniref:DUF3991 domain-containing protein n=1 Tax=Eubacterium limosum TaxID=1736 RepID=A0A6N3HF79_EUBLI|nr:DUF3991 and TOPRIM domain-containing protein [Eubacterium callanderi]
MNFYEKKEIAEQMSIVECCSLLGFELVYRSNRYKHPGWNGLSISSDGNAFTDFAKSCEIEGGGSVRFIQWYYSVVKKEKEELTYGKAIDEMVKLKGYDIETPLQKQSPSIPVSFKQNTIKNRGIHAKKNIERQPLVMPSKNENHRRVFAYLTKTRKIDPDIVQWFLQQHLLYESKDKLKNKEVEVHNCVFVNMDYEGNVVGASLRGTMSDRSFKGSIGNDTDYGFVIKGNNHRIRIFESVIDLMSRKTLLKKNYPRKYQNTMDDTWMSLNGLKDLKLYKYLENHPDIKEIIFSVDNDPLDQYGRKPGPDFCEKCKDIIQQNYPSKYSFFKDMPRFKKDWNEELVEIDKFNQLDYQQEVIQEKQSIVLK